MIDEAGKLKEAASKDSQDLVQVIHCVNSNAKPLLNVSLKDRIEIKIQIQAKLMENLYNNEARIKQENEEHFCNWKT
jgi:hypothetical protein